MRPVTGNARLRRAGAALFLAGLLVFACGRQDSDFGGTGPVVPKDSLVAVDTTRAADTLRFATLNMSIGFPVSQLLFTNMANDSISYEVLSDLFARYQKGHPGDRIRAMARAIDSLKLDVVGLQEVMSFRKDGVEINDFLQELVADIAALGGPAYKVLPCPLNDTVLTGKKAGQTLTIAFHEGDAMLINPDFELLDSADFIYFNLLPLPTGDGQVTQRALQYAKFRTPKGIVWQAFNTHLEVFEDISSNQALEVRRIADSLKVTDSAGKETVPRIVLGDFNVSPGTGAHRVMTDGGFRDTFDSTSGDPGFTCCVAASALWVPDTAFSDRRIDFILARRISAVLEHRIAVNTPVAASDGATVLATDHRMVHATLVAQ